MTGHSASSTSIFVSWGQVPFPDQNGVILSYTVTYRALPSGSSQKGNVTAPANHTTLSGLNEYTNYSITVFASTSKGGGNQSTPIVVITDEDSKFVIAEFCLCVFLCCFLSCTCVMLKLCWILNVFRREDIEYNEPSTKKVILLHWNFSTFCSNANLPLIRVESLHIHCYT